MKTQKLFLIATILFSISFASCKKVEGCKDRDSINYNPDAEVDDGSCEYKGSYVFWVNTLNAGESIVVSCNGTIGELTLNYTGAPSCGTNNGGAISLERTWKGNSTISLPVILDYYDSNGDFVVTINTTANLKANTCVNRMVGI